MRSARRSSVKSNSETLARWSGRSPGLKIAVRCLPHMIDLLSRKLRQSIGLAQMSAHFSL